MVSPSLPKRTADCVAIGDAVGVTLRVDPVYASVWSEGITL